jgi:ribosome-associated heat shock protein Hsp15
MSNPGEARIDKWLWAARIYKTRTLAADACKNGRISINGANVKASRCVKVGDKVGVRKPPITYTFRVLALTENRLGAKLVPDYLENITPQSQYDLLEMTRISGFVDRQKGLGRPTKRDAREMAQFKEQSYAADTFFLDWEDDDDEDDLD